MDEAQGDGRPLSPAHPSLNGEGLDNLADRSEGVENPARGDDNIAKQIAEDGIRENSTENDGSSSESDESESDEDEELGDGIPLSPAHPSRNNLVRPYKFDLILQSSPPGEDVQEKHAWNPDDRTPNILVKDGDKFTAYCTPDVMRGYIRGKMGYSCGFHVWQLHWPVTRSGFVVGVATNTANLHTRDRPGLDQESYGWSLGLNTCYHDFPFFPSWRFPEVEKGVNKPHNVYCILDMDEGFLAFATDETYLGVAFRGLKGKTLYPVVSVFCKKEITMKYLGEWKGSSSSESDESEVVEDPTRGVDNIANKVDDGTTRSRPRSVLSRLLSFLPCINSGSTSDGSTGEKNDEDDRDETNNVNSL